MGADVLVVVIKNVDPVKARFQPAVFLGWLATTVYQTYNFFKVMAHTNFYANKLMKIFISDNISIPPAWSPA
jgi:hypothetical protein